MQQTFSQKFSTLDLLKFAAPSIVMMILMSLYTIVDGIFVSRYVGSNALSSINIVWPYVCLVNAISTMLGTGGNAIISRYMGQHKMDRARQCLTSFVLVGILCSVVSLVICRLFLSDISYLLGSNDELLADCNTYLILCMTFAPAAMLQGMFQSYFVTSGNSSIGLYVSTAAGIFNMVFDYVFIVIFHLGVAGAAIATGIGQCIPALVGLWYFTFGKSELKFTKFSFNKHEFIEACYNGSSEMVTQLSNAIMTYLFNVILMRLAGSAGVAAITIILYGQFVFVAFYLGLSVGISPIVGYKYGANDKAELKHIYKIVFLFTVVSSVLVAFLAFMSADLMVEIFTKEKATYDLTVAGFKLFSISFIFSGFNVMSSGFFTALSNGKISALISFCRTLVFTSLFIILLSNLFGTTGTWLAVPAAEFMTCLICAYMHKKYFLTKNEFCYF